MSILIEGPEAIKFALLHAGPSAWAALAWQSIGNTLFGFAAWSWLVNRYPAATITPAALLIPVFGMGAAAIWLHEPLPAWKLVAASLLLSGLSVNYLWPLISRRQKRLPMR